MDNMYFKLDEIGNELTIRKGDAPIIREDSPISIVGVLESPLNWLKKRISLVDELRTQVVFNRELNKIQLVVNEAEYLKSTIVGQLVFTPLFESFHINGGVWTTKALAAHLKMNRNCFLSTSEATVLIDKLMKFEAKINTEVEKADDNFGNKKNKISQAIETNLPANFSLKMPIFKGIEKVEFEIEIYISDQLGCSLVSVDCAEQIAYISEQEIEKVLDGIKAVGPNIVIIEE